MKKEYLVPSTLVVQIQMDTTVLTVSNLNIINETVTTQFWDDGDDLS